MIHDSVYSNHCTNWDIYCFSVETILLFTPSLEPTPGTFESFRIEELVRKQFGDPFRANVRARVNGAELLPFQLNEAGCLVCTVENHSQLVIFHSQQSLVLYLSRYPKIGGHSGWRRLYVTLHRDFYWHAIAVDCYLTVQFCLEVALHQVRLRKNAKQMALYHAKAPLLFVAIDIMGPLLTTKRGNEFLLVSTEMFVKLVRMVPLRSITAFLVAHRFLTHRIFAYSPPIEVLSDNEKQFASRLFQGVCWILDVKNLLPTTFHPQTDVQDELFN